jgi:hypothetical protein
VAGVANGAEKAFPSNGKFTGCRQGLGVENDTKGSSLLIDVVINGDFPYETIMPGTLSHQPQQQTGKPQRLRPLLSRPALGLHHNLGMQPDSAMTPYQRHTHTQQTRAGMAFAFNHT